MSRTAARVSMLGIFLVLLGALLLLRKLGVIDLQMREIIWPVAALLGLFLAGRGLVDGRKGRIVWGTALFLYGIFFVVRSADRYDVPLEMVVPATFAIFGIAFVMLFVNRPSDWYFLAPGLLLLLVGGAMMLTEFGYWYGWEIRDAIATWWPVALVLMGAGMLLKHRRPSAGPGWPGETVPPQPPPPPAGTQG